MLGKRASAVVPWCRGVAMPVPCQAADGAAEDPPAPSGFALEAKKKSAQSVMLSHRPLHALMN